MYADDILLLFASFSKFHEMINIFHAFDVEWHISFKANKYHLYVFGVKAVPKTVFCMGAINIHLCNKFQYTGVMLVGGKVFNADLEINRTKLLTTAYAILNRFCALFKEAKMQLISSQCVPILLYSMEYFNLTVSQEARLSVALKCVVRRIYRLNRMISVEEYLFYNSLYRVNLLLEKQFYILIDSCTNTDV